MNLLAKSCFLLLAASGTIEAGEYTEGLALTRYSADKDGFGTVMMGTFTIKSTIAFAAKDIEVACDHFAPSGTKLGSTHKTIYDAIAPGKSRTFSRINMGFIPNQSSRFSCAIVAFDMARNW